MRLCAYKTSGKKSRGSLRNWNVRVAKGYRGSCLLLTSVIYTKEWKK